MMIPKQKQLYLCRPSGEILTVLNGVRTDDVTYEQYAKDYNQITFTVDEYIIVNGKQVKSNGYDDLDVYMNVLLPGCDMFQMQMPVVNNDGQKESKQITAYSLEKEFEQHDWVGLKVNTGEVDSLEYLVEDNVDEDGFAKHYITLYDPNETQFSLLHYIQKKMPGWSVNSQDIDQILWYKKCSISEDNINLYALLTSVIAPKLECLFLFDTINRRIKAVSKQALDDYTHDTNIFISFRNLANNVDIEIDEDSVYTSFSVSGDNDLNLNTVNYGTSNIYDLSYFLREPYMPEDDRILTALNEENLVNENNDTLYDESTNPLIDGDHNILTDSNGVILTNGFGLPAKIRAWQKWRDDNRDHYMQLQKQRSVINDKIYELNYKVPNDTDDYLQWDNMDHDLLLENLEYYKTLLTTMRVSVDPDPQYDEDEQYIPIKNEDDEIDEEFYEKNLRANKDGYYTYIEIRDYIIPNIEIALSNEGVIDEEKTDYVREYETNWALYGLIELRAKRDSYQEQLETLKMYGKDWDNLTAEEKAKFTNQESYDFYHKEYVRLNGYLGKTQFYPGSVRYKIYTLENELKKLEYELSQIDAEIAEMNERAAIEYSEWGLSEDDIKLFYTLGHHTDYQNSNIFTTSIDDAVSTVDISYDLYEDAVSKLSEVSQPQYHFSVDLDNLLNIPEFMHWEPDLELLNYVRLGIRDDYSVKLRLISIKHNPCEWDPLLELEFSNFITSRSGRSDLTDLLNTENNRGSKNSIQIGTGNSKSDKEYATNLLQTMIKSGLFKSAVSGVATGVITVGSVTAGSAGSAIIADSAVIGKAEIDEAEIKTLISDYIRSEKIDVTYIKGDEADFNKLFADYIDADYIATRIISADQATIDNLQTKLITADNATINQLISDKISAAQINVTQLIGDEASFNSLVSSHISTSQINVNQIIGNDADFENLIADHIGASEIDVSQITGDYAEFAELIAPYIEAGDISAETITAKLANLSQANIETLFADNAFTRSIQSLSSTTATSVINDAYIYNAVAGKIAVSDLAAGNIVLSDTMKITSENGALLMNGTVMQITGEDENGNPYVGVQLGYDTENQPSLILRNSSGATVITPEGITADAVADELIVNNMIKQGTISEDRLGFSVMKTGDKISITQIMDGSGNDFGIRYTEMEQKVDDIEQKKMYRVEIRSSNGNYFKNGNISSTLSCHVYSWDDEITDDLNASCFKWTKINNDGTPDSAWNTAHFGGAKSVTITSADVYVRGTFTCTVTLPDGSTVSSGD